MPGPSAWTVGEPAYTAVSLPVPTQWPDLLWWSLAEARSLWRAQVEPAPVRAARLQSPQLAARSPSPWILREKRERLVVAAALAL